MINLRRIVEVTHVFDAISGEVNFRSKFRTFFRTLAFLSRDRANYRVLINLAYHGTYYERGTESLFNSRERNRNTCVSIMYGQCNANAGNRSSGECKSEPPANQTCLEGTARSICKDEGRLSAT